MVHEQCADAVLSLGGQWVCVACDSRHVQVLRLEERERQGRQGVAAFQLPQERGLAAVPAMGSVRGLGSQGISPLLPFHVYSMSSEPSTGWVVLGGADRSNAHHNIGLLRLTSDEASHPEWMIAATWSCGRADPRTGAVDQVNSVRFAMALQRHAVTGQVQRRPVLLVGSQDRHVYIFPVPPAPTPRARDEGAAPVVAPQPMCTHAFPTAINCACASPDGRWLAATGDREEVYLVGGPAGFVDDLAGLQPLVLPVKHSSLHAENDMRGCQYLSFSADSRYLAVSSDSVRAVAVWELPLDGVGIPREFCRMINHKSPVLALCFIGDSHQLAYATKFSELHVVDMTAMARVEDAWNRPLNRGVGMDYLRKLGVQRLSLDFEDDGPMMWSANHILRERINGLCTCGPTDLLVALPDALIRLRAVTAWSKELHNLFPPPVKAAVRLLLLCSHSRGQPEPGETPTLCSLPPDLMLRIIACAAFPQWSWLDLNRVTAEEEADLHRDHSRRAYGSEADEDDFSVWSSYDEDDEEDEDEAE